MKLVDQEEERDGPGRERSDIRPMNRFKELVTIQSPLLRCKPCILTAKRLKLENESGVLLSLPQ
jgi:hypothetical protein